MTLIGSLDGSRYDYHSPARKLHGQIFPGAEQQTLAARLVLTLPLGS